MQKGVCSSGRMKVREIVRIKTTILYKKITLAKFCFVVKE